MSTENIIFSIIIPSFNRPFEIKRALQGLVQQTYKKFEVVVVDDCSNEVLTIDKNYPFSVHLCRNETNLGAAASRNIGVNCAQGEWVVFLDDDDEFMPNKLEELYKKISADNKYNFIYHKAKCIMINEQVTYETYPEAKIENLSIEKMLQCNQIGGGPMIAIKKDYFVSLCGFNQSLRALEDYEFTIRLVANSNFRPAYIDSALTTCNFYTKRQSVSKNHLATLDALDYIEKAYKSLLDNNKKFKKLFNKNKLNCILFLQVVNLDRKCFVTLLSLFTINYNPLYLVMALVAVVSPRLFIYLRKYKNLRFNLEVQRFIKSN